MSNLNLLWCSLRMYNLPGLLTSPLASKTKQTLSAQKGQAQIAKKMGTEAQDEMVTFQQLFSVNFQYIQNHEVILLRWPSLQTTGHNNTNSINCEKCLSYWLTKW